MTKSPGEGPKGRPKRSRVSRERGRACQRERGGALSQFEACRASDRGDGESRAASSRLEHRTVMRNRKWDSPGVANHDSPCSEVDHGQALFFGSAGADYWIC